MRVTLIKKPLGNCGVISEIRLAHFGGNSSAKHSKVACLYAIGGSAAFGQVGSRLFQNKMDDIVDDVHETLIESGERVRRGATWFWSDFTCMILSLLLCRGAANLRYSIPWA